MATHDYIIANASGSAVRADLNNALAAIVSNNSNATAPATTYAYQWWADTTAGQLKLRNSTNTDWVVIQELDGTMLMEDGTAAAPGLSFASDTDTGLFSGGADKLGLTAGGVERAEFGTTEVVFNDSGADVDFRVEGDTEANLLFVDAGNDRVGIGTNSPSTTLHISGNSNNTSTLSDTVTDYALKFDSATTTDYYSNAICFAEGDNVNASICSIDGGTGGAQGLIFGTGPSNTQRFAILSDGNIQFGSNGTNNSVQFVQNGFAEFNRRQDTGFGLVRLNSSSNAIRIGNASAGTIKLTLSYDGDGDFAGDVDVTGTKNFRIPHPLSSKTDTHNLYHCAIETTEAGTVYPGMVDLVDGTAVVNIDTAHRMTEGTFEALNTVQSWMSSNETGYSPVKCSLSGNLLTIECQDATSTDTVYYEVRGIRKDQSILDSKKTDDDGRLVIEALKPAEVEEEF